MVVMDRDEWERASYHFGWIEGREAGFREGFLRASNESGERNKWLESEVIRLVGEVAKARSIQTPPITISIGVRER